MNVNRTVGKRKGVGSGIAKDAKSPCNVLQWRLRDEFLSHLLQVSVCLRLVEDDAFFLKLLVNLIGLFQKVEIKETKQDEKTTGIQTFTFQMSAEISPPQLAPSAQRPQSRPASGPAQTPPAPAKKG